MRDDESSRDGTALEPERTTRPDALLAGIGADAFEAFNAMETTKRRHFAMLERLDAKRTRYGLEPTLGESALLADLLTDHDAQVLRFTRAASALKAANPEDHRRLFAWVGTVATVGSPPAERSSEGASASAPGRSH